MAAERSERAESQESKPKPAPPDLSEQIDAEVGGLAALLEAQRKPSVLSRVAPEQTGEGTPRDDDPA